MSGWNKERILTTITDNKTLEWFDKYEKWEFEFYVMHYVSVFQSPYAQLLAATTLTKLVSRPNVTLPLEQRIDIRKHLMHARVFKLILYLQG